ncbi:hypothetical protein [Flavobacterium sp.]
MEIYKRVIEIIDVNIILCLFPCILFLMIIGYMFKNHNTSKKALNIIRWFVIGYFVITFIVYLIAMLLSPDEHAFVQRATGPYWFGYWLMLICSIIFPLSLLLKKLASKYLYVLLVVLLMKIGFYFERFVIIATTIHRDYLPSGHSGIHWGSSLFYGLAATFLQGLVLALLLLAIVKMTERKPVSG